MLSPAGGAASNANHREEKDSLETAPAGVQGAAFAGSSVGWSMLVDPEPGLRDRVYRALLDMGYPAMLDLTSDRISIAAHALEQEQEERLAAMTRPHAARVSAEVVEIISGSTEYRPSGRR